MSIQTDHRNKEDRESNNCEQLLHNKLKALSLRLSLKRLLCKKDIATLSNFLQQDLIIVNLVPRKKLRAVLLEYDVRGQLLADIKSLYKQSEFCMRVNGIKTKSFSVNVGLRQGCVLSSLLFIIYMDKLDQDSFPVVESPFRSVMFGVCCLQMTLDC